MIDICIECIKVRPLILDTCHRALAILQLSSSLVFRHSKTSRKDLTMMAVRKIASMITHLNQFIRSDCFNSLKMQQRI